jgi:hypothetical protein
MEKLGEPAAFAMLGLRQFHGQSPQLGRAALQLGGAVTDTLFKFIPPLPQRILDPQSLHGDGHMGGHGLHRPRSSSENRCQVSFFTQKVLPVSRRPANPLSRAAFSFSAQPRRTRSASNRPPTVYHSS